MHAHMVQTTDFIKHYYFKLALMFVLLVCLLIFLTFPLHLELQSPEKGTDKARLLARMSKMGKNPLSLPGAVVAEPESDDMVHAEQEQVGHGLFLSIATARSL